MFYVEYFNSVSSFLQALDKRTITSKCVDHLIAGGDSIPASQLEGERRTEWTGTASYKVATDLAVKGWQVMTEKIKIETKKILGNHARNITTTAPLGFAPIVPNAIKGLHNAMMYTRKQVRKTRTLDIIYSMSMSCANEAQKIQKAGCVFIAALQALEAQGIRVRLGVAPMTTRFERGKQKDCYSFVMDIKDFRQPFNAAKMSYWLAHASAMRRHGFSWFEKCGEVTNPDYFCGYGYSFEDCDIKEMEKKTERIFISASDIIQLEYNTKEVINLIEKKSQEKL